MFKIIIDTTTTTTTTTTINNNNNNKVVAASSKSIQEKASFRKFIWDAYFCVLNLLSQDCAQPMVKYSYRVKRLFVFKKGLTTMYVKELKTPLHVFQCL
jgi:hypothetical protein